MLQAVQTYYTEIAKLREITGTQRDKETVLRAAFINLLNDYAKQNGLTLVTELSMQSTVSAAQKISPDGTLKDNIGQSWGYWEAKDPDDNLDEEIKKKFYKGYPAENILFEDTQTAVLFQNGKEVMRCSVEEEKKFDYLLKAFVRYEPAQVSEFRQAIELFKQDVPAVTATVRELINKAEKDNRQFIEREKQFLALCRENINPDITVNAIQEMMIQHILTEDLFTRIFGNTQFHRENNIARELENVCNTFFYGEVKQQTVLRMKHYYDVLNAKAAQIADHHEKQKVLKVIYEAFYRSYNPLAADRLGVIYTPNEIVQFMVRSVNDLLQNYFRRYLEDKNVEILDPAVGTGTFICELLNSLRKDRLEYKFRNEIHANEISILPYYVSNLNIELTYYQRMNQYVPFENLVFADTLENMSFGYEGKHPEFGFMEENVKRITRQNKRTISVIIGNPPYNANQKNEDENNANRKYPQIDKRIKDTFIKNSTAQKTKAYDPLFRFCRWAFDRVNEDGIVAFVMNRIFIDGRWTDGFRKTLEEEFEAVYVVDLGGDIRKENKKTPGNVFDIQVGVAVLFCIKKKKRNNQFCQIYYIAVDDTLSKEQKLQWLANLSIKDIEEHCDFIRPDERNNWINLPEQSDWDTFLPLCSKKGKSEICENVIFQMFTLGTTSNRDDWVYDADIKNLQRKVRFFVETYNQELSEQERSLTIKYTRDLKKRYAKGEKLRVKRNEFRICHYRCFAKQFIYFAPELNEMRYLTPLLFPKKDSSNFSIAVNQNKGQSFSALATDTLADLHFNGDALMLPYYRYGKTGKPNDNITPWALEQFRKHYGNAKITRKQIFYYVYAVLYNPAYRKKYETNLKYDYPRIPFYDDFTQWTNWGKHLLDLHIGYENVKPHPLQIVNKEHRHTEPKTILEANKTAGEIILDENTKLTGVPSEAWEYTIGKRSALEWILDQYKEKKPRSKTVAEQFNPYRFADYKEQIIDLLRRVCTVSIETVKITEAMQNKSG